MITNLNHFTTSLYSLIGLTLNSSVSLSSELLNNSSFITSIYSVVNPTGLDINFANFLQIEMLGQGLYTYGAI